ncbi:hypothetical protein N0V82_005557 [Gnomoniopsis sp. IMI 355080]|nr:hypothetical protein N0V82_005557 [Gnomoniopsis sp. IMI 355080]
MASKQDSDSLGYTDSHCTPPDDTNSSYTSARTRVESLINDLPSELIHIIYSISDILEPIDLKALRLTCRAFNPAATSRLFKQLPLSRLKTCRDSFFNISSTPHLARHVEIVVWHELCTSCGDLGLAQSPPEPENEETWEGLPGRLNWMLQMQEFSWRTYRRQPDSSLSAVDTDQITAENFREKFMTALDQMPNLHTFVSAPMPSTTVLDTTNMGYQLTATHARNFAREYECLNDGFFEFLVPALHHLGSQIKTLAFIDESCLVNLTPRGANAQSQFSSAAFSHLTSIHLTLDCFRRSKRTLIPCINLAESLQAADNLELLTVALKSPEPYGRESGIYPFSSIFLNDAKKRAVRKWAHLRSVGLEGFAITSDELTSFVGTHVDTLRHVVLRDCMSRSSLIPALAAIDDLLLSTLQVQVSDRLAGSIEEEILIGPKIGIKEDDVLRFVNRQTPHNPLSQLRLMSKAKDGDFLFTTSFRPWVKYPDLFEDDGYATEIDSEVVSEDDADFSPLAEELRSADSEIGWVESPFWTWGRFYHRDHDNGEVYCWQTDASAPASYGTQIWKWIRSDGEFFFYMDNRGRSPSEPPEEVFDDWDSDVGDVIEATAWEDSGVSPPLLNGVEIRHKLESTFEFLKLGPIVYWGFWEHIRKKEPPQGATLYDPTDHPVELLSKGLARFVGYGGLIEILQTEEIVAENEEGAREAQIDDPVTGLPTPTIE